MIPTYYSPAEQNYHPRHGFFNGRFTEYPDVPERTRNILAALAKHPQFQVQQPPPPPPEALARVHGQQYLRELEGVCARLRAEEELFPFFMRREAALLASPHARLRIGYFAVDGSTPLVSASHDAALGAASTAVAGAEALLRGDALAYSLPRPPGHHAGRETYAGFCLINNAALAAELLAPRGKVAILDVDFHHGNGTQEIFYERGDVLYVSLHCRPEEAYPYIRGRTEEQGQGAGRGANLNLPLPGGTDWAAYGPALEAGCEAVATFAPDFTVISLGVDTLEGDPTGLFRLQIPDYAALGRRVAQLPGSKLIVQEGGYKVASLGACVLSFFSGLGAMTAQETTAQ